MGFQLESGHRLPVAFDELRFIIKGIYLADRPRAEDHQHLVSPRFEMSLAGRMRTGGINNRPNRRLAGSALPLSQQAIPAQQGSKSHPSQSIRRMRKKIAAVEKVAGINHDQMSAGRISGH